MYKVHWNVYFCTSKVNNSVSLPKGVASCVKKYRGEIQRGRNKKKNGEKKATVRKFIVFELSVCITT